MLKNKIRKIFSNECFFFLKHSDICCLQTFQFHIFQKAKKNAKKRGEEEKAKNARKNDWLTIMSLLLRTNLISMFLFPHINLIGNIFNLIKITTNVSLSIKKTNFANFLKIFLMRKISKISVVFCYL